MQNRHEVQSDAHMIIMLAAVMQAVMQAAALPDAACITPSGLANMATGCGRPPPSPHLAQRITLHVATCQEDLGWLPACDSLPGLRIRVVHKCSASYAGFVRAKHMMTHQAWMPKTAAAGGSTKTS